MNLRNYQAEAVKEILHKKRVILADDMNLGKCAETISVKNVLESRLNEPVKTLISCPGPTIQHWKDEIGEWYKKKHPKIITVNSDTYDSDLHNTKGADFVLTGYHTLSQIVKNKETRMLENVQPYFGIIDEGHNAKNPDSLRSMAVVRAFDPSEYLAIATGTPIPNTLVDIYMLLHLLDKKKFPLDSLNTKQILSRFYAQFKKNPGVISDVINDHIIQRSANEYLKGKMPDIEHQPQRFWQSNIAPYFFAYQPFLITDVISVAYHETQPGPCRVAYPVADFIRKMEAKVRFYLLDLSSFQRNIINLLFRHHPSTI